MLFTDPMICGEGVLADAISAEDLLWSRYLGTICQ